MTTEPAAPAAPGTPAAAAPAAAAPAAAAPAAAAPAAAAPAAEPAGEKPWWDATIKEEPIREYMKAKNYQSPEEVARAAWSATKMLAERGDPNSIIAPKADAPQEDWDAFYNKLGRPETPDKYEFKHGEGVEVDPELEALGRNIFHKAGVGQKGAQEAINMWNEAVAERHTRNIEASRVANEQALEALKATYGANMAANQAAGERVVRALGLDTKALEAIESNIGSAAMVDMFVRLGMKGAEGGFKGGNDNPPGDPNNVDNMDPAQAQAKIDALNSDETFQKKYTDKNHGEHASAVALMERLFAKAGTKKSS